MKTAANARAEFRQVIDIRQPEQAARLTEAYSRERHNALASLKELEGMIFVDRKGRENAALSVMAPIPGHELMDRAPREVLRLRAALFLISCHAHRHN